MEVKIIRDIKTVKDELINMTRALDSGVVLSIQKCDREAAWPSG